MQPRGDEAETAALDLRTALARKRRMMMTRNRQPRKPVESAVEMAVAAVEDSPLPSPLDVDMDINTNPTSLDLVFPDNRDNRHAAKSGAARGGTKGRS
jgi:hypothetical protein